jgi:hypothetical protein
VTLGVRNVGREAARRDACRLAGQDSLVALPGRKLEGDL